MTSASDLLGVKVPEYSPAFANMLFWARILAAEDGVHAIRPQDLLIGMFRDNLLAEDNRRSLVSLLELTPAFRDALELRIRRSRQPAPAELPLMGDLPLSSDSADMVNEAVYVAESRTSKALVPLHLLLVIIRRDASLAAHIHQLGLSLDRVERALDSE
jgi:hypothetical protein